MRGFRFGDLASLLMIETRLAARDRQLTLAEDLATVDGKPDVAGFRARMEDPSRRLMSEKQEAWIAAEAARSVEAGHAWQVLGADPPGEFQDSVVVPPGETLCVAFTADNPGLWALHSLVAERADGGLIGSFTVAE